MFNYGFELFVNLFQGVMFTVFCYKFLTPSRNKICEGIAFCVASLLMFFFDYLDQLVVPVFCIHRNSCVFCNNDSLLRFVF